jgi:hypothetical protein
MSLSPPAPVPALCYNWAAIEHREDADPPGIVDDCVAIVGAVMSKQPLDRLGATFDVTKFEIVAGREAAIWLTTDITFSLAQKIDR